REGRRHQRRWSPQNGRLLRSSRAQLSTFHHQEAPSASPYDPWYSGRMGRLASRVVASILVPLLSVSSGTVKEAVPPRPVERVLILRAPRLVASPVVEESELRRTIEYLLPVLDAEAARAELRRMVADPRFHDRLPEELRVVLANWGSGPVAREEI